MTAATQDARQRNQRTREPSTWRAAAGRRSAAGERGIRGLGAADIEARLQTGVDVRTPLRRRDRLSVLPEERLQARSGERGPRDVRRRTDVEAERSEEHTSELQSRVDLVCR